MTSAQISTLHKKMINLSRVLTSLHRSLCLFAVASARFGTGLVLVLAAIASEAVAVGEPGSQSSSAETASQPLDSSDTSAAATSGDRRVPDAHADPVRQQEAELERLQGRLEQLRGSIADNLGYRDALLQELKQFEQDVDALARANHRLDEMVTAQQQVIAATASRLETSRLELSRARADLATLVRTAYALGRGDQVRLLLGQDDPRRAERMLGYYQLIGARRAARVEEIRGLQRSLQRLEQQEREETSRLARLASRQDETRRRLEGALRARQAILSDLEQTIAADQSRASALEGDAEAMRALIERLKRDAQIADEVGLRLGA